MNHRSSELRCTIILILIAMIFGSCEDYFEYSPYAANVKSSHNEIYVKNFKRLTDQDHGQNDEIKIAVIADSHYNYHELNKAVVNINSRENIDFVVANGDITDHGYLMEYELFHEQMHKLISPYLTVIGNHDYKSNGDKIYKKMYGSFNKSFVYNDYYFILFDDVFWESSKEPDFNWLENELIKSASYEKTFVFCHIPPYGEQFPNDFEIVYRKLMLEYKVDLSIHGHVHRYQYEDYYKDGMIYLTVESIMDKEYCIITIHNDSIVVEAIKY